MEWSSEVIMEFLDLYEREPVIWNPQNEHHNDRNHAYEAWKRIQNNISIECSLKDLKKKKEHLMSTYRKLSAKVKKSTRSGARTSELYKPKWFAFDKMASFLQAVYTPRVTKTTEAPGNQAKENDETYEECGDTTSFDEESNTTEQMFDQPEADKVDISETVHQEYQDQTVLTNAVPKREANSYEDEMSSYDMNPPKIRRASFEESPEDFCSSYGKLLAMKLRGLNKFARLKLMNDIDNLAFRAQMEQLETSGTSAYSRTTDDYRYLSTHENTKQHQDPLI